MRTGRGVRRPDNKKLPQTVSTGIKTTQGFFLIETSAKGLYAVRFPGQCPGPNRKAVAGRPLRRIKKTIETYFKDPNEKFGLKLDLTDCTPFQLKVYAALRKVAAGTVVTYNELAKRAGYPGAARAVGTAMKMNRLPVVIPCHRVVPASGGLGSYSAGKKWKRWLLEHEGCKAQAISHKS